MEIHFTVFGNHGTIDLFRSGSAQLTWKQMMMTGILSEQQMLQQKVCGFVERTSLWLVEGVHG